MQPGTQSAPVSKARFLAGIAASALVILFLLFDSSMKLLQLSVVKESQVQLGIPDTLTVTIGAILLACVIIYAIPRTAVLGGILLTGYLGGAIAIQTRILAGAFPILFPAMLGLLLWGGLWLRDERVRELIPLRRLSA